MISILYLHGLSTGDFEPALEQLLGEDAAGLSSTATALMSKERENPSRPVLQVPTLG